MSDQPPSDPSSPSFVPVCAIGASAGGVGALQTLFRLLPDDLGLAYVVVVHLAPDHPSAMHEIIGACTKMPVHQVTDGPTLQPNCVYVIAPDSELVINGDDVQSRPFTDPRRKRAPIDMFFRSIAAGRGDGIAAVLTGAGSDGALGVRAIKEAGGIVMVQEPAEAGYPSMPQNAIATGVADVVAPLARLAERIAEAARSKEAVRSLDGDGAANDVRRIVAFLRTRTGHDFSGYKRSTVLRRIQRRMQVSLIDSPADYLKFLRANPEEAKELLSDLLISVTMFFRDPETFITLGHRVIRPLLEARSAGDTEDELRAWVVGCATGEEAYSLAILLLEEADQLKVSVTIQIFATDLDEGALATAREGRYPRSIEADVSAERLKRFFVDEGTHYRIAREVRDLVLFATHSVVREPPFMRLDLITCRNVLIYLERALQSHVNAIFRYGLKPDGYLFLGTAETADTDGDQFAVVDRDARIYRALPTRPDFLPTLTAPAPWSASRPALTESRLAVSRFDAGEVLGESHAAALEASAPPSMLVDADQNVLHLSPTAGRFVQPSAGPLSAKLSSIVQPELRLDLKLALDRAFEAQQPTITRPIDVLMGNETRRILLSVTALPTTEGAAPRAVVYFLDGGPGRIDGVEASAPAAGELQHLHSELKIAQEAELAGRIRHESATQELRASNEELQSLNEEYRSTAEELETSKEELQSINEELQTVNAELKSKLGIISAAHNDLQNLTASSEIGTLFLDLDLRIRMFTPPVAELINLASGDVGRPITNFTHRLDYDGIDADIRRVLRDLAPFETEASNADGRWFMVRIRPYRTLDSKVEGAVVTFDDITERKRGEAALRESENRHSAIYAQAAAGFAETATDGRFIRVNPEYCRIVGRSREELLGGLTMQAITHPDDRPSNRDQFINAVSDGAPFEVRKRYIRPDGSEIWVHNSVAAIRGGDGRIASLHATSTDVSRAMQAEIALRESEERQAFLLRLADALRPLDTSDAIIKTATDLLRSQLSANRCAYYEIEGDDYVIHVDSVEDVPSTVGRYPLATFGEALLKRHLTGQSPIVVPDVAQAHSAAECEAFAAIHVDAYVGVTLVKQDQFVAGLTVQSRDPRVWSANDVTMVQETAERIWASIERARAETALKASEEQQRLMTELVPALLWQADPTGQEITATEQWPLYTGQSADEIGNFGWLDAIHPDDLPGTQAAFEHAFATGEPIERQQRIRKAGDGYRWHLVRHVPVRNADGEIVRWFGAAIEIDELHRLQDRQQVMVKELQHRTRNLITVVSSLSSQTLKNAASLDDFRQRFGERLAALSRVQGLLSHLTAGKRVTFDDLLGSELAALGAPEDKVTLDGPSDVSLRSATVQTFALALHELATNALKYGALTAPGGHLTVRWSVERAAGEEPRLHVDWRESGVTLTHVDDAPRGSGYGRELIEHALPYQLGAQTTYEMTSDGVHCTIAVPIFAAQKVTEPEFEQNVA